MVGTKEGSQEIGNWVWETKAGIQRPFVLAWIPSFEGMTKPSGGLRCRGAVSAPVRLGRGTRPLRMPGFFLDSPFQGNLVFGGYEFIFGSAG